MEKGSSENSVFQNTCVNTVYSYITPCFTSVRCRRNATELRARRFRAIAATPGWSGNIARAARQTDFRNSFRVHRNRPEDKHGTVLPEDVGQLRKLCPFLRYSESC